MTSAYTHNGDRDLMLSLGLRVDNFARGWTALGTVVVVPAEQERPAATVEVEVLALPAQAWRFTITRPRDAVEDLPDGGWRAVYEPLERFVMNTGTGGFGEFWPTARMVALHWLTIGDAA